ncbi:MAG: FxDxF family PEP-CTERM protein [Nitrosomonas sp.]|nr:FxDxF family PEP-CTERM protein [Nitrosomonas sp.]MDP1950364.1 FxDxF family PEP-CTERM protein [Nitrosomonas sp.]
MKNSLRMIGIAAVMWFGLSGGVANALTPGSIDANFVNNGTSFNANFGNDSVIGAFIDHHTFTATAPMFGLTGSSLISGFKFPLGFDVVISSFELHNVTTSSLVASGTIIGGIFGSLGTAGLVSGNIYDLVVTGAPAFAGVVGTYSGNVSISPIPEPETYAMLLVGLGLVGFTLRRRKTGSSSASLA